MITPQIAHPDAETIVAQCTPSGSGALALLRLSGTLAIDIATHMSRLASGSQLKDLPSHTIHYGMVIDDNGEAIDQVMFLLMRGPKTFTGQDTVEITCHNNQHIINQIIATAGNFGARLAQPGEFTKRAVLNGKLDLLQAEALHELIQAQTQGALKISLAQLNGSMSCWVRQIEELLLICLAYSEASFEFLDEEHMTFGKQIRIHIGKLKNMINKIKDSFNLQQQIRHGIRIALIGSVNAGKSSLFNALLQKDRAIVSELPGTTRDTIEAHLFKGGTSLTLVDTAGLRETNDIIEQQGIERSWYEAKSADIILLVVDGTRPLSSIEEKLYHDIYATHVAKTILVYTKLDLEHVNTRMDGIHLSSLKRTNIDLLEHTIAKKINALIKQGESPFLLTKRQYHLLTYLDKKLDAIDLLLEGTIQYELVSYHLNDALTQISELTGKSISEKAMDTIFREFCIGK